MVWDRQGGGVQDTHVARGNEGHVVLNALDSGDLASPKSMAAAQTFDEATAREVRVASAHARLSSAEGVAVVVDVAAVDVVPVHVAPVRVSSAGRCARRLRRVRNECFQNDLFFCERSFRSSSLGF